MPDLRIFFHDRCFDGAASAALFAEFFKSTYDAEANIEYCGLAHSSGDPFAGVPLDASVNACLDFRYCADERMHWWFDHHQSAFQPATRRALYDADTSGTKFYDPKARSCALFAFQVMSEQFGFELKDADGHWNSLLEWADQIDGALFESAREIVELKAPALQLMTWLRNNRLSAKMAKTIEQLGHKSMQELVELPWIAQELPELLRAHHHAVAVVGQRVQRRGAVATYDLLDDEIETHSGFAAYMHCPEATYSVGLARAGQGLGISVGCNPWVDPVGTTNIAAICEEFGGGGHPQVGGISVPGDQGDRAREIVAEIVRRLG